MARHYVDLERIPGNVQRAITSAGYRPVLRWEGAGQTLTTAEALARAEALPSSNVTIRRVGWTLLAELVRREQEPARLFRARVFRFAGDLQFDVAAEDCTVRVGDIELGGAVAMSISIEIDSDEMADRVTALMKARLELESHTPDSGS